MVTMKLGVALLRISSVAFVAFALAPDTFADLVTGAVPATPSASIDMRATYGGVALGLGVFYWLAARRAEWVRMGVLASLLVIAGIAAARAVGIVADGQPNTFMLLFLVLEVVAVVLSDVALRRLGREGG